ncbi:hypothetical protein GCM10007377_15850 [Galliscardovia ingluviei]|uniref:Uncharacterized protein n=1 Tax=Galliscardovia ingluviei TaxID=1769422 RepID=A0A8J3AKT5_9BIFI|nr:hypothetical protein GCM10007377_15850 [Galliscardovia ingluviei]
MLCDVHAELFGFGIEFLLKVLLELKVELMGECAVYGYFLGDVSYAVRVEYEVGVAVVVFDYSNIGC